MTLLSFFKRVTHVQIDRKTNKVRGRFWLIYKHHTHWILCNRTQTHTHTHIHENTCIHTHTHTHTHTYTHTYICKRIVTVEFKSHLFLPETLKTTLQNEIRIITLELNGSQMEMSDVSTRMIFGITVCLRARYSEENQLLNVDFNFKILCIILI